MTALPFGMIRRINVNGPQGCIQATHSDQHFRALATAVPSAKLVQGNRSLLARIERLETQPSQVRTACPLL